MTLEKLKHPSWCMELIVYPSEILIDVFNYIFKKYVVSCVSSMWHYVTSMKGEMGT